MLCGERGLIAESRRVRKMLGGGMRQAGIIAAAGIYALANNVQRLGEDHENAKSIARALAATAWARVDPAEVVTNILYFTAAEGRGAESVVQALAAKGIMCFATGPDQVRFVTHLDVSAGDTREIVRIVESLKP
jgi:threonine aldolase